MKLYNCWAIIALLLTTFIQPASAASIISIDANGNNVYDYGSMSGYSELVVDFNNLQTVSITFNNFDINDQVYMDIYNSTGVGWSGFEFQLIGAGFAGPYSIEPQTTSLNSFSSTTPTEFYGYSTHLAIGFDGFETSALLNGIGTFVTEPGTDYTLLLTPTTVPVPAAVWLFGSGLIGLIGMARRKA